jgi:hypothetical protein
MRFSNTELVIDFIAPDGRARKPCAIMMVAQMATSTAIARKASASASAFQMGGAQTTVDD